MPWNTVTFPSDLERIRDLFDIENGRLPLLKAAMTWVEENTPEAIATVQNYLTKVDANLATIEDIYGDPDYALSQADVVKLDIDMKAAGALNLEARFKLKIWKALNLENYFDASECGMVIYGQTVRS